MKHKEWWKYSQHTLVAVALVIAALLFTAALVGDKVNLYGKISGSVTSSEAVGSVPRGTLRRCQSVANRTGMRISSSWRSASRNQAVGGVYNSMHTHGSLRRPGACDFSGTYNQYLAGARLCKRGNPRATEVLIHEVTSGLHLHCGFVR